MKQSSISSGLITKSQEKVMGQKGIGEQTGNPFAKKASGKQAGKPKAAKKTAIKSVAKKKKK